MSLHRFLQVDNYIHDPTNTQNYNQYGYVLNNPLLYTDPSGNAFNDGKDCVNCGVNYPAYNPDKMQYNKPLADGLHRWVGGWASARNIDEAGTAVGKAARDAVNFIGRNIRSLFGGGHRSSGPPPNMSSYANLNKSFDFKTANNITDQRPLIQQYNEQPRESYEEYDPKGSVLTAIGSGIALGEYKMFNKDTWYSLKMMRTYNQSFNGNGYTGGKIASALKISKGFNWLGKGLGVYNAKSTLDQFNNNQIDETHFIIEEVSNGYSTLGGLPGAAWGIGWEGGRAITKTGWYQDWKHEHWYPFRYEPVSYTHLTLPTKA